MELLKEALHISMSSIRDPPSGLGVQPILKKQELFVKVIDCCRSTVAIALRRFVELWPDAGVVHFIAHGTAECKRPRDPKCANGIESVSVLNDLRLKSRVYIRNTGTFEGCRGDYAAYVIDHFVLGTAGA